MGDWYRLHDAVITLALHVQPGAKRSEIIGLHGDALKIRLSAPPIDGRANEAVLKFIAELFDVPLRNVTLKQGEQSRRKIVTITDSNINPEVLLVR